MGLSHTVSGNVASFRTPSRVPIESLKFHFLPKQEGSGDPSPTNVRPITGWTGLNGGEHGINLWDEEWELGAFNNDNGEKSPSSNCIRSKNYIPCKPNTSYYLRHPIQSNDCHLYFYGKNKEFIDHIWKWPVSFITPSNCYYIRFYMHSSYGATYLNNIGINYPSSKTSYVKYTGNEEIPITFPSNGKNIFDVSSYPFTTSNWISGKDGKSSGNNLYKCTLGFIPIERFAGKTLTLNKRPGGVNPGLAFYTEAALSGFISGVINNNATAGTPMTFTVPANAKYMRFTVPVDATDIQIELGDTTTDYEPYSSDNTFYGGYIDPVAGEIVAEYEMIADAWKNWVVRGTALGNKIKFHRFNNLVNSASGGGGICISNVAKKMWKDTEESSPHFYITHNTSEVPDYNNVHMFLPEDLDEDTVIQVLATLVTPIHIPITPQDLQTFLDHNNFWSDANDITEVTYAVTESKDILATRKKAMDFDIGHHKKVQWNQWAPAVTGNKYAPYNSNKISVSIEDGIITQTFLKKTSSYGAAVTTPNNMKKHALNRYYYLSYEYCTDFVGKIGGTVGGQYLMNYVKTTQANVWDRFSGIVKRTEGGNFNNYVVYLGWFNESTGIEIGSTCQMRNPIAIDLTQMFGAGNEPTTRAEFEKLCAINGIDLTTYHPIDSGTEMYWIIP